MYRPVSGRGGGDAIDGDLQVARATQHWIGSVRRWVDDQTRVHQPAGEFGERELGLQPGQRCAEAVVDAAAEAEVLVGVAGEAEPVGVEPVGVEAVGVEAVGVVDVGGVATFATDRFRFATAATKINDVRTSPARGGVLPVPEAESVVIRQTFTHMS